MLKIKLKVKIKKLKFIFEGVIEMDKFIDFFNEHQAISFVLNVLLVTGTVLIYLTWMGKKIRSIKSSKKPKCKNYEPTE